MHHLVWNSPILDMSGYSSAARGYLTACEAAGISVRARDRSRSLNLKGKGIDQPILDMYERLYKTNVPADCPSVQHTVPPVFHEDRRTKLKIGYTIFELDGIPKEWVAPCNRMDVLWTGSEYSRKSFLNSGVTVPIKVLPHAIDIDAYGPDGPKWAISNRRGFAFLSVMDMHDRKAWKETLRAYWTAFKPSDDVCFILKAYFGSFSDEARKDLIKKILAYRESLGLTNTPPILLYGHDVPGGAMPALYRAADCYVGISREGFGLSYSEAMACGLACIGPEVGGTRCYMTPENSFLVKHVGDEPVSQEMLKMEPSFAGLKWATHSWEHLSETMRLVVYNKDARQERARKGMSAIRKELSFKAIGSRIAALLSEGVQP